MRSLENQLHKPLSQLRKHSSRLSNWISSMERENHYDLNITRQELKDFELAINILEERIKHERTR